MPFGWKPLTPWLKHLVLLAIVHGGFAWRVLRAEQPGDPHRDERLMMNFLLAVAFGALVLWDAISCIVLGAFARRFPSVRTGVLGVDAMLAGLSVFVVISALS